MNNAPVKAIAISDRRVSPWFYENIAADESIDCHLIDVAEFLVDIEIFDSVLAKLQDEELEVILLDSALPSAFLAKMAMRISEKTPGLPVVLLPRMDAKNDSATKSSTHLHHSADTATETMTKAIRYACNRQQLQLKLLQLALKDDLTGLHNRRGFVALAKQQLRLARIMKRQLLLFFADVDGLKQINDRFGHHEGDCALMRIGNSFKKTFRESDVTARLCGDEFVALVIEAPERNAETISRRLQRSLARRAAKESRYRLSLSIGVARFDPEAAASLQDLLAHADKALYVEKRKQHLLAQPNPASSLAHVQQHRQPNDSRTSAKRLATSNAKVKVPTALIRQRRPIGALLQSKAG